MKAVTCTTLVLASLAIGAGCGASEPVAEPGAPGASAVVDVTDCLVTRPTQPGFTPPEGYPPRPSDPRSVWFGTADLWTLLPVEEPYGLRKSVWWSTRFQGGAQEPMPQIRVTWQRRDVPAPPRVEPGPGTNALTVEDGWFMIAGIDPEEPGCWEVTASYRGTSLSYTYLRND